jgi:hypothetical protein
MALAAVGAAALDVGSATAHAAPDVSPFAGSWSGTWIGLDNGQDGTLDVTISDAGRLSGRVFHTQDGQGGEVRGHVSDDGLFNMVAFAPSDDRSHGCGVPLKGAAVIDDDGELRWSYSGTDASGNSFVAVFERN